MYAHVGAGIYVGIDTTHPVAALISHRRAMHQGCKDRGCQYRLSIPTSSEFTYVLQS